MTPDIPGALLFGHYAFPPNRLGYCGPDDHQALFEYVVERRTDSGLLELERRFQGTFPYLRLIALANHIADPFDRRVAEGLTTMQFQVPTWHCTGIGSVSNSLQVR